MINVAVIGVGYLGKFHAEKYASLTDTSLVGVVDSNMDRAEEVAHQCGTKPFRSYRDILDKVDAVSIVTPTATHFEIAKEFLENGADVMLEKPMTNSVEEAAVLVDITESKGSILQIGHLERFNPAVLELKKHEISPLFIESDRLSTFPNRGLDVDVVLDLMIHDIDIILNLVDAEFEGVEAVGVPVVSGKIDMANARLAFKNGCIANVTASRVSNSAVRKIRFFQPNKYVSVDYAAQKIKIFRKVKKDNGMPCIGREDVKIERKDALMQELVSFLECVRGRKPPLVSGRDGKRALRVASAVQTAIQQNLNAARSRFGWL